MYAGYDGRHEGKETATYMTLNAINASYVTLNGQISKQVNTLSELNMMNVFNPLTRSRILALDLQCEH